MFKAEGLSCSHVSVALPRLPVQPGRAPETPQRWAARGSSCRIAFTAQEASSNHLDIYQSTSGEIYLQV